MIYQRSTCLVNCQGLCIVRAVSIYAHLKGLSQRLLKQILINLLSNGVKFTSQGGSVIVRCVQSETAGHVLEVSDTGSGIANDDIPRLMEPFRQGDGSLTRKHEGSGLGLTLSRLHAEAHGGDLQVFSELGKGTTVRISLPASRIIQGDLLEASG